MLQNQVVSEPGSGAPGAEATALNRLLQQQATADPQGKEPKKYIQPHGRVPWCKRSKKAHPGAIL